MEKLYTVDDIAKMTMLTSRTIRNYLKDGLLKGKKIGGQWRFTEEDIKNLMNSGTYKVEHQSNLKQDILDFLDGTNDFVKGELQACAVVDLYQAKEVVEVKIKKLMDFINARSNTRENWMNFSSEYVESEAKTRVVLFAPPAVMGEMMGVLGANQ